MAHLRRTRGKRALDAANADMTPMLDIVFILLIFFIVTAVFMDERGIAIPIPSDVPSPASSSTIRVYVFANDTASVDGAITAIDGVPARVSSLLANKPKASVSIEAEFGARWNSVVFVKDEMDAALIDNVVKIAPDI